MVIKPMTPEGQDLAAVIAKWTREADGYVAGAMFPAPVGDMNRASADVVRRILRDLQALLLAEGPKTNVADAKAMIEAERLEIARLYAGAEMELSINLVAARMAQLASYALDELSAALPETSAPQGDVPENTTDNPKSWIAWKRRAFAAEAKLSAQAWRDIASAPKDGGYVLLVSPAHGLVIGAHVTGDVWHLVGVGAITSESERPTHWMPLPALPETSAQQEEK